VDMLMAKKSAKQVIAKIEERQEQNKTKQEIKKEKTTAVPKIKESILKTEEPEDDTISKKTPEPLEVLPSKEISENIEDAIKIKKPRKNSRDKI